MSLEAPLTAPVFATLLSLSQGEKHGYAIMKDARQPEGGGIAMGPGTLYGTLNRLMEQGLVVETGLSDDQRRRYYQLTESGHAALTLELDRLRAVVRANAHFGLATQGGPA